MLEKEKRLEKARIFIPKTLTTFDSFDIIVGNKTVAHREVLWTTILNF